MAKYITAMRTSEGDKQIDYNYLANLPVIPKDTNDIKLSASTASSLGLTTDKNVDDAINAIVVDYNEKIDTQEKAVTEAIDDYNAKIEASNKDIADLKTGKTIMMHGETPGNYRTFVRPVHPIEIGPYVYGTKHFVCDRNDAMHQLYIKLVDADYTVLKGQFSYSFEGCFAYRLNHITKKAELLCDLTGYIGTANRTADDGIIAVDDQYIYFVQHTVNNGTMYSDGTTTDPGVQFKAKIYKFNHNGQEVGCGEDLNCSMLHHSNEIGTSEGGEPFYEDFQCSLFLSSYRQRIQQTKNFILIKCSSRYCAISKNDLSFNCHNSVTAEGLGIIVWYKQDVLMCNFYTNSTNIQPDWVCYKITTDENKKLYQSNPFKTRWLGNPFKTRWLGSAYTVYIMGFSSFCDVEGKQYILLRCATSSTDNNFKYTVVTEDDLDPETCKINVTNHTTAEIPLDITYYDPVLKEFTLGGQPYQVYPAYVPPTNTKTLNSNFSAAPFFKTNDYFYFIYSKNNAVYKLKNEDQYVIDRVEVVE